MINVKLNSQTTLIIHDDKSVSIMQDSFIRGFEDPDEIALPPTAALELKSYLEANLTEDK